MTAALNTRRLAADFSAAVRRAHTDTELANICERNNRETDLDVDHVHDYHDANDLMAEAVTKQLGPGWSWCDHVDEIAAAWADARAHRYQQRRVLAACEFSGIVRDAFIARGHDAVSCDLRPTEQPGPHIIGDVREHMTDGYDTMLAFPPCTYLCSSGLHWNKRRPGRAAKTEAALEFVRDLLAAPVDRIALENPQGCISTRITPAAQYVQPYEFGEDASKKTGLWLTNLPKLKPTLRVPGRFVRYKGKLVERWSNQTDSGQSNMSPSETRSKDRERTYPGIALAMSEQWG